MKKNIRLREINLFYDNKNYRIVQDKCEELIHSLEKYLLDYSGYDAHAERVKTKR